jgi:hypothetical protein
MGSTSKQHESGKGGIMKELAMRGTRIGALSFEDDRHIEPAARLMAKYRCADGHELVIPFSVEAEEIPMTWTCRCGLEAQTIDRLPAMVDPEEKVERPARTHWDMLLERRTIADLEVLLAERLALLHETPLKKSA